LQQSNLSFGNLTDCSLSSSAGMPGMRTIILCGVWAHALGARVQQRVESQEAVPDSVIDRNLCPVLAALQRHGALKTDNDGNAEINDIFLGLHLGLKIEKNLSAFQAFGITAFPPEQKNKEEVRERCIPGVTPRGNKCFQERFVGGSTAAEHKRFINVQTMTGKQVLEHGISTGVRGGHSNMPPGMTDACRGKFPCEALFRKFFLNNARNGRMYMEDMMKMVCLARQIGDRGGEHSYREGVMSQPLFPPELTVVSSEWQMKGAMTAMLAAFGRRDSKNKLYMTTSDLRALMMEGRYPDGWVAREHGCLIEGCEMPALTRWRTPVQCDVPEGAPFWKDTRCPTSGKKMCRKSSDCAGIAGSFCMDGRCTCQRGRDGRQMCFKRRTCVAQTSPMVRLNGKSVKIFKANNPGAPGNQ